MRPHLRVAMTYALVVAAAALLGGAGLERLNGGLPQFALDVPYLHTPHEAVDRMLQMADVGPDDFVIDLGSGDGRIVIAAARDYGARGLGVDIDPARIQEAQANALAEGLAGRVAFRRENLFDTDLRQADVVTMYLLSSINLQLRPRLLELKPGTRIASHAFQMGAWKADAMDEVAGVRVYLWIVPAKVDGNWRLTDAGGETLHLTFAQSYQEIEGAARKGNGVIPIRDAMLKGDEISFVIDAAEGAVAYEGRVTDDGIVPANADDDWRAVRVR